MTGRTVLVAGLGRCGTSLVMRMLDVAGVTTIGDRPDWECMATQLQLETDPAGWATAIRGRAVKLLDAHRYRLPPLGDYDLIWLYRDEREQAKSGLKLAASMFSTIKVDRREIRAWAAGLRRDAPNAIKALEAAGPPRSMTLRFEHIIADPFMAALSLCRHLGVDTAKAREMASQVIPRGPECLPYLLELSLVDGAGGARP